MNDVSVRDFVKMHYQFSAKVMDPNFIRRVAKERNRVCGVAVIQTVHKVIIYLLTIMYNN